MSLICGGRIFGRSCSTSGRIARYFQGILARSLWLVDLSYEGGNSYAADINNEGQIVGMAGSDGDPSAALWENGQLINLNDLLPADSGWNLEEATGINDSGQIIGWGNYDGQDEGFLLTPDSPDSIPEPATLILAAGFPILFRRRHRRRN